MLHLMTSLDRSQFTPSLIVFQSEGPLAAACPRDIAIQDLARPRLRQALLPLIGAIRRTKPKVVVSSLGYVSIALLACRYLLPRGTRIVVREANMPSLSLPAGPAPAVMRWLYRRYYPRADVVVCTSNMMMGEMAGQFRVPRTRLQLLPNPVDEAALRAAAEAAPPPDGDETAVRFVAAGRLTRQKGFDRLIELFADLPAECRLTILGEGQERAALEQQRDRLGLGQRIQLPGFSDTPWSHYAAADAFLLPSRWEGMPNAALEALACGTPVIATPEAGAIAEIAAAAPDGVVTIASWSEDFASAVSAVEARAEPALRPSLLPRGHEAATVARRFEGILRPLC